ncbi:GTPase [Actinoplanes flavus]|uniref:50S ribosome-binding GTPase n=1 Tax=Actinoplanes flavus TaxID=2820290 RepID=A0ABS3UXC9_9ACTN|nr:GTPase [Actinoplanes flavus]MBO3743229.1 50S ribosome-binding GTPase [Actinoplanes flavus]
MTSDMVSFEDAVRSAVEQGRAELARLDEVAGELGRAFAQGQRGSPGSSALVARLDDFTAAFPARLRSHLDRERESLASFNIAFFGRTGVGKSTLLSVFGRLDGSYVSPGESDCTTEVQAVEWRNCRLYDTPGINGWGRTESRESLEAKARRAVEIADVVLLCFDSQSQQAMEFTKIAAWIRDYGKPAVAVLNSRNAQWHHPARVVPPLRRNLSEQVRQHADNIRTHLVEIGLPETPIVAIHSQRALFARAATPFRGVAADGLAFERDTFGIEYLERWSNFGTLERLMAHLVEEGAADLRLAALRQDVRSRCQRGIGELEDLAAAIDQEAESLERDVESLFAVLGYPDDAERAAWLHDAALSADLAGVSEVARGVPYTSPPQGTLDRFVRHLTASHLAGCRRQAKAGVDELIRTAFAEKRAVEESEFIAAVFDEDAVGAAVAAVWADRGEFLHRELEVAVGFESTGNAMTVSHAATILGGEGSGVMGDVVKGSGIALGLGAAAVPLAALLLSNPVGWVIGATAVGVGIVSQVQQYFGKKMSDEEAERAREARSQATVAGHRAVDETFGGYEDSLVAESRKAAWTLLGPAVAGTLRTAIELRTARARIGRLIDDLRTHAGAIAPAPAVADVLQRAQRRMGATTADVTRLFLGEDWLESATDPHRPAQIDQTLRQRYAERRRQDHERLTRALATAWNTPSAAAIRSWRAGLEEAARHDPELFDIVRAFWRVDGAKPAFVVLGDYNSGKSSLVRRIMVDSGREAPAAIDIRATPATVSTTRYPFGGFDLVDTPGLQSGHGEHDTIAYEAIVEAALVFVVVHINLLVGDTAMLEDLARGAETIAAKGARMVFLINRCDELGMNPLAEPGAFLNLQDRKREELRTAFAARGVEIGPDRIHCLSGDPFGLVGAAPGAQAAAFDENRLWDGVAALTGTISGLGDERLSVASSSAAFDTAVTGLKRRRHALEQAQADAEKEMRRSEPVIATVRAAVKDAVILENSLREAARRTVDRHLVAAKSTVVKIERKDVKKLEDLVQSWWKAPEFEADLERYLADAAHRLDEWYSDHMSAIGREMRAAELQVAPELAAEFEAKGNAWYESVTSGAGNVAGAVAPLVNALGTRDAVYAIGKYFGHTFKPWGAVTGAARVARAGFVLGLVASAADVAMMANDKHKDGKHKDQQDSALREIDEAAAGLVEQIMRGDRGDGPVGYLEQQIRELEALLGVHLDRETSLQAEIDSARTRAGTAGALITAADELTGTTGRNE